ncbi:MAG: hypothetical protein WAV32_00835 [Halobacteriota archaeon]
MKHKENMRAIALFGMLIVVISFGIQTASAGSLGGGDSFENATQIYSGYSAESPVIAAITAISATPTVVSTPIVAESPDKNKNQKYLTSIGDDDTWKKKRWIRL